MSAAVGAADREGERDKLRLAVEDSSMLERLVRIEVTLEALLRQGNRDEGAEREIRRDFEDRLRKVERTIWLASGMAAAAGGALGTLISQGLGGGA